jgi:hypothetical protein
MVGSKVVRLQEKHHPPAALAAHASHEERAQVLAQHRLPLWSMGVFAGLLGAAPSVLWASGAMFIALAPLLVPLALWIYMLVFAFASLWFAHYLLAALEALRSAPIPESQPWVGAEPGPGPEGEGRSVTPVTPAPAAARNGDIIDVQAKTLP